MQLGSFEVPEKRLIIHAIPDLKLIYDSVKTGEIKSADISSLFGYKHPTATPFYHRLNSLSSFGLLEGRGKFRITTIGKDLLFPESDEHDKKSKNKAILHVPLWKSLYAKYKKDLPAENFWVQLKNITGVQPDEAKKVESEIKKWYGEDIVHVTEELVSTDQDSQTKGLSLTGTTKGQMQGQLVPPQTSALGTLVAQNIGTIEINDKDTLSIAQSYLNVLKKKIEKREAKGDPQFEPETENINGKETNDEPDN